MDFFVDFVPDFEEDEKIALRTNSKYLAVCKDLDGKGSRVTLYDLQAIKERSHHPNSALHFDVRILSFFNTMHVQLFCTLIKLYIPIIFSSFAHTFVLLPSRYPTMCII